MQCQPTVCTYNFKSWELKVLIQRRKNSIVIWREKKTPSNCRKFVYELRVCLKNLAVWLNDMQFCCSLIPLTVKPNFHSEAIRLNRELICCQICDYLCRYLCMCYLCYGTNRSNCFFFISFVTNPLFHYTNRTI